MSVNIRKAVKNGMGYMAAPQPQLPRPDFSINPDRLRFEQLHLARFRPASMDWCNEPACFGVPEHNRGAHQQLEFPAMLYSDQGGDPTLGTSIEPRSFFNSNVFDLTQGNGAFAMGKPGLWSSGLQYGGMETDSQFRTLPPNNASSTSDQLRSGDSVKVDSVQSLTVPRFSDSGRHLQTAMHAGLNTSQALFGDDSESLYSASVSSTGPATPGDVKDGSYSGPLVKPPSTGMHFAGLLEPLPNGWIARQSADVHSQHLHYLVTGQHTPYSATYDAAHFWSQHKGDWQNQFSRRGSSHAHPSATQTWCMPADLTLFPNGLPAPKPVTATQACALDTIEDAALVKDHTSEHSIETPSFGTSGENLSEAESRRRRDAFLVQCRDKGMSYKEIKRQGRFSEAVSTLRGRIRLLTKDKSERVRRPKWDENDIALLIEAVANITPADKRSSVPTHTKFQWREVSEWMIQQGCSYPFAPATCAKKWKSIQ